MIRILVTGSRLWGDVPLLTADLDAVAEGHDRIILIHGRCDPRNTNGERVPWHEALADPGLGPFLGADWHGHHHALARGWAVEECPANWFRYGNSAGPVRNQHMVSLCSITDVCVAAPLVNGDSPGTRDCMTRARRAGIRVVDITLPPEPEGLW